MAGLGVGYQAPSVDLSRASSPISEARVGDSDGWLKKKSTLKVDTGTSEMDTGWRHSRGKIMTYPTHSSTVPALCSGCGS